MPSRPQTPAAASSTSNATTRRGRTAARASDRAETLTWARSPVPLGGFVVRAHHPVPTSTLGDVQAVVRDPHRILVGHRATRVGSADRHGHPDPHVVVLDRLRGDLLAHPLEKLTDCLLY